MNWLALGVLLLAFLAAVPLLRFLQRRRGTPPILAHALRWGLRAFWTGFVVGLLAALVSGPFALFLSPFAGIAVGAAGFLAAFLIAGNVALLRLAPAERRKEHLAVRWLPGYLGGVLALALFFGWGALEARSDLERARSPRTTERELRELYSRSPEDQRLIAAIAANPSASDELIAELARGDLAARYVLASSPRLPVEIMRELAADSRIPLRRNLARNPSLPADLMELLRGDPDPDVRAALAGNPAATAETLRALASDPEASVRRRVALNRNAPTALLQELARDPDVLTASNAEATLRRRSSATESADE